MPFKSDKQRKFMWARHPEIAKKWTEEEHGEQPEHEPHRALSDKQFQRGKHA